MTAERIRVLHLGKYFPPVPGGMETFCADLQRAFADSEVDSRMLIHLRPGQPPPATPGVRAVPTVGELFFTPLARGLGSSSAALVAGAALADAASSGALGRDGVFQLCAGLEGHPDNVAPAFYGGFTVAYAAGGRFHATTVSVEPVLALVSRNSEVELGTTLNHVEP